MKAVVVHGAGDLRVDELPDPTPQAGEVLIAMEWGGVCGSDVAYWRNGASGTAVLKHPLVLGHEMAGRIAGAGPGVTGFDIGQPVTVHPATPVGGDVLPERLAGRTNLYPQISYCGSAAFDPHTDGGFCELKVVRADQIRTLPDAVGTDRGALAEPLAVAMHAVNRAGDLRGRDVLVNGAGPIGSLVVAAAKLAGAATVAAADVADAPLAIARSMGADVLVNLRSGDELPTDVELVFEASGAPAALGAVLQATARGGTIVQVGNLPGHPTPANLGGLVTREITWVGSYRFIDEITDAIVAMSNGLDVNPLITHRYSIDEAADAIAVAADRDSGSSKVLLRLG
ncbi:MAG TPA: L-idonate 5-dehydrogenase [Mycobacterium sp.]|nr:L-idonate 5-dehydrogenase [Mycobacterium sp.]